MKYKNDKTNKNISAFWCNSIPRMSSLSRTPLRCIEQPFRCFHTRDIVRQASKLDAKQHKSERTFPPLPPTPYQINLPQLRNL